MIIKFNRKYSFHSIYLVLFLILLISNIASAEVEINATLEDNLVILLDYSGSTVQFREAIESNAIYSIQNIESDTNVSVVVYGGFTKKSNLYPLDSLENRTTLENFVLNIKGKEGDVTKGYIYEGFDEARKILNNSTGTKQIALISDGNLDGKYNGKLDNDALIELVKEIKKNVTINLYQVLNSSESLTLKKKSLREPYKDFSDQLSTEVMILNPDEKIRFLKVKFNTTIVSVSSEVVDSSQAESSNDVNITSEGDEYLNEFSNDGEIKNVSIMYYGQKGSLLYRIHFYSYCNQNDCIIVPFDIGKIKFYKDKVILQDIFRSKDTIELVKSGNINELAYTFSSSNIICEYYDINVFKKEGMNLGGEVAPSVAPKSAKIIKQLKTAKMISKINYGALVASAYCLPSNNDEILYKIAEGAIYTQNLKVGYAYNGIVKDFQNYNKEIVERITERKNSSWNLFYILNNPLYDKQLPLINNNYVHLVQLSNQNYETEVELAISRFNDKSEQSYTHINNAVNDLNELDSQIPFSINEIISNFLMEPDVNYTNARIKQKNATSFLNSAEEYNEVYKFNSAIKNSESSITQSKEGIELVNIEKSKNRDFKNWVKVFGVIVAILLILSIGEIFYHNN